MSFRIATRSLATIRPTALRQVQVRPMSSAKDDAVSLKDKAAEKVKQVAQKFKADGEVGSKFTSEGEVGKKFDQEVGGAFSKDGAIGKQFEKDGAVGGTGQQAAEKTEQAAKEAKK